MARYAYDVNTTQRYIDVHKQFQGGLKTVDTDDALGAVFLRQAENVSLSEFGFIEKRHGSFEKDKTNLSGFLQGYWEFKTYKIHAINNNFYVNGNVVTEILKENEEDWRYPTLPQYPFETLNNIYRDMNAVNINEVLYIFTGYYPVYAKVVEGELKFYWFSVDIPTYDEIVVVGHNLLEDDYEGLYFSETSPLETQTTSYNPGLSYPKIQTAGTAPKLANKEEPLKFFFNTQYPQDMDTFSTLSNNNYFEINLDSVSFRTTGAGASNLDFIAADIADIEFEKKSNYSGNDPVPTRGDVFFSQQPFTKVNYRSVLANTTTRRDDYRVTLNFEITKSDFLKNNKYTIETYRYIGDNGFINFVLEDYDTFNNLVYPAYAKLKITPIDFNGNELKKQSYTIDLTGLPRYIFSVPTSDVLNQDSTIEKYKFELDTKVWEGYLIADGPQGPTDLESNPENYYFDVVAISEKEPATSGNIITSSFVPALNFSLKNLISGRYDFKVKFVREEWRRVTESGQFQYLELVQREFFETIITDVIITEEKLQDFPRKDADSIGIEYPKLHPIWSCNKVIEHFNKLMVWGSKEMPTAVFYSFPDRPTYFPSKFYLDFQNDEGSAIQNVTPYMNILVAQTEDRTWGVRGNSGLLDSAAPYVPFTINPTVGTIAYKSVRPVRNHLFFLSKQGIIALKSLYAADEQYNIEFVDRNIKNIVPQDAQAVGIQYDNQYWLNFPNFGITLRWYIDKKAWVLDNFDTWKGFKGVHKWQIVDGQLEFISYPSNLKELENLSIYKVGIDYSLPTDLGETIFSRFETSFLNQNYPFHPKSYKETKLDFTLQNEYNISKDVIYYEEEQDLEETKFLNNVSLIRNHRYRIYFYNLPKNLDIDTLIEIYPKGKYENGVDFGGSSMYEITKTLETPNTDPLENSQEHIAYLEFLVPNDINGEVDIKLRFPEGTLLQNIELDVRDSTYDNVLNFLIWVLSENNTLNQGPIVDYGQIKTNKEISLQDRLGDWEFGQTDFGKKITAVNTIKLSGKGYNAKIFMEDYSKSKWTLESVGLTYKMKRARSR